MAAGSRSTVGSALFPGSPADEGPVNQVKKASFEQLSQNQALKGGSKRTKATSIYEYEIRGYEQRRKQLQAFLPN